MSKGDVTLQLVCNPLVAGVIIPIYAALTMLKESVCAWDVEMDYALRFLLDVVLDGIAESDVLGDYRIIQELVMVKERMLADGSWSDSNAKR